MKIGVLKEIKQNENRVALTPAGAKELIQEGHEILIQKNAGLGSGLSDDAYKKSGATLKNTPQEITQEAGLILKIKEPTEQEYALFPENQIIFTYFHFASSKQLTDAMLKSNTICIAYETVEKDNQLVLLDPMSEVAGKMSAQVGAQYLAKPPGKGTLISAVSGVEPANVIVIGAGSAGLPAMQVAAAMGANVTVLEIDDKRIAQLKETVPENVQVKKSTSETIATLAKEADVIIGAVLLPGGKAPIVLTEEIVKSMAPGSVLVDISIDQGGCFATSKPTSHANPIYEKHGVIHYCVTNMPAAYPRTSTFALTSATLSYVKELAKHGIKALKKDPALQKGLNIYKGKITNKALADSFGMEYTPVEEALL